MLYTMSKKEIHYSLFGTLLGDSHLRKNSLWLHSEHTEKQRFYVEFLEDLYKKWGLQYTSRYGIVKNTTYGKFTYCYVSTKLKSKKYFLNNNRFFDASGKKIASEFVLKRITPFGLLLWYLDDGNLSIHTKTKNDGKYSVSRFANIATHSFTYENQKLICKILKERFDLDIAIHKDRQHYKLYLNATNFRKFYDIVREYLPYIPQEFEYKFNMKYEVNRLKASKEFTSKYNFNHL